MTTEDSTLYAPPITSRISNASKVEHENSILKRIQYFLLEGFYGFACYLFILSFAFIALLFVGLSRLVYPLFEIICFVLLTAIIFYFIFLLKT